MTDEKIIRSAQTACVLLVASGVVYFQLLHNRQPVPPPTFYFFAKNEASQTTLGLGSFVSPTDLRLERVNDLETNVWGWFTVTNISGNSKTQWFRCVVSLNRQQKPYARTFKTFPEDPQSSTNAVP